MRLQTPIILAAALAVALTPATAQRRPPSPDQRIDRLEKQVRQVQKQVFPRGQPADTAGVIDDPAATQEAVNSLTARIDSVERQMADLVRATEENGNRLATMEAELARLRAEQDRRLRSLESGGAPGPAGAGQSDDGDGFDPPPPAPRPKVERPNVERTRAETGAPARAEPAAPARTANPGDPDFVAAGEQAYDQGYQLWTAGRYEQAITALRAMASSFPGHRRVSWANNLAGRALLDKGDYRAAAEALLANYRTNKDGERAPDSLYYLGQASMKLGQPAQACKAYAELENVYGATLRSALRSLLPAAKAAAKCQ